MFCSRLSSEGGAANNKGTGIHEILVVVGGFIINAKVVTLKGRIGQAKKLKECRTV